MTFGNRLKELRTTKKLTQIEMSKQTGLSQSSITAYENNKREPNFEVLQQLATFFNVSTDYLLGKTDIPNATILSAVPSNAAPIDGLIGELFADRPDVLALLKNGVYDDGGKYRGKKLSDLSDVAKKHLRDTIISVLEMSGYLQPKS